MLTGLMHVFFAGVVWIVLGVLVAWLGKFEKEWQGKRQLEAAALSLGVPVKTVESDAERERLRKYLSERFSGDLFVNRISDFCGTCRLIFSWGSLLMQTILFVAGAWSALTGGVDAGLLAWFAPIVYIVTVFYVSAFSYVCKIVTGRFPNQPREVRKVLIKELENAQLDRQRP